MQIYYIQAKNIKVPTYKISIIQIQKVKVGTYEIKIKKYIRIYMSKLIALYI